MSSAPAAVVGSVSDLHRMGRLVGKLESVPIVVFKEDDRVWAVEDRCPHMGFPLHRGTVQDGLLTCHWHHARFDLTSGCTFDLWADDAVAFDVELDGDDVVVRARDRGDEVARLERRLEEGIEEGLTLVIAKAVHGLLAREVSPTRIASTALRFAASNRSDGWGPGMTVVQAVLNLLPHVEPNEQGRALTQGVSFLARDTRGHPPRFPVTALDDGTDVELLGRWSRRFIENRSAEAAERATVTAVRRSPAAAEAILFAACTDHVYLDEGHVIDYLNKACEATASIGGNAAEVFLPTVVGPIARAVRHEEVSEWREPVDLLPLIGDVVDQLTRAEGSGMPDEAVADLGEALLDDDPRAVADALVDAGARGATAEQLARAVAYAAALRLVRFHTQNDVGDWETVHHTFTSANAVHQAVLRQPTPELVRGAVHGAFRVYLDRFLNVPAARPPRGTPRLLEELEECWNQLGGVNEAGEVVAGYLANGGDGARVIAELCRALLREDAGFHWFQSIDAAATQHAAWPAGSAQASNILIGVARWLAAHTPTVRATDQTITIARRLQRGEALYEATEAEPTAETT